MQRFLRLRMQTLRRLMCDERGATAIEYAMIAAGIAVAIVATVTAMGASVQGMYETVRAAFPS